MTRSVLDAKLQEISTKITQLGTSVLAALEQALRALQNGDQALCRQVIESIWVFLIPSPKGPNG